MTKKIVIGSGPSEKNTGLSPSLSAFLLAFGSEALAQGYTIRHGSQPDSRKILDQARGTTGNGRIEAVALKKFEASNPGGSADEVSYYDDLSSMRQALVKDGDVQILIGGRTFADTVEGTPGMVNELGAFTEANSDASVVVLTGFGGCTAEDEFLALARGKNAIIISETDPDKAVRAVFDALS